MLVSQDRAAVIISLEGERLLKGEIMSQCHLLVVLCGTAGTAFIAEWR